MKSKVEFERWKKEFGIHPMFFPKGEGECWLASSVGSEKVGADLLATGFGWTEEEAALDLACYRGWPLWDAGDDAPRRDLLAARVAELRAFKGLTLLRQERDELVAEASVRVNKARATLKAASARVRALAAAAGGAA